MFVCAFVCYMWEARNSYSDSETDSISSESSKTNTIELSLDSLTLREVSMEQICEQLSAMEGYLQNLAERQGSLEAAISERNNREQCPDESKEIPHVHAHTSRANFFTIPDPIKELPSFDGNRKQLMGWIAKVETTLNVFRAIVPVDIFNLYEIAVSNKIIGRANDVLCQQGSPHDFETVKSILLKAFGEKVSAFSTYKSQLWQLKLSTNMSIHKYYSIHNDLVDKIKIIAKQNPIYRNNWEAINCFINEDALAAFIAGLSEEYYGHVQAAQPKDVEEVYNFLCMLKTKKDFGKVIEKNDKPTNNTYKLTSNQRYEKPHTEKKQSYHASKVVHDEPMDTTTTRSKLTQRSVNNHETYESETDENFWSASEPRSAE